MDKTSKILIIIAILMMALSFLCVYYDKTQGNIDKIDTVLVSDTIRHVDTLTLFKEKPTLKIVKIEKVDTFYTKDGKDTIFKTENKLYQDTLCNKNDSIILKSYISGQNPTLDSIKADWRKSETIITNTVTIEKYIEKKKTFWSRFHVGVQTGYGYGFNSKQLEPYVGAGLSIDIN